MVTESVLYLEQRIAVIGYGYLFVGQSDYSLLVVMQEQQT